MRAIEITDNIGNHVTNITNFDDVKMSEEINAGFNVGFTAYVDDNLQHFNHTNLIKIDGQLFIMARISRRRDTIPSLQVDCDHVSYALNRYKNDGNDFEGTPQQILSALLYNTPFSGTTDVGAVEYYFNPGNKSIRECLIEFANYVGGELYWDNFTVRLLNRRGSNNGLEFKVGENIQGLNYEMDMSGDAPRHALEVDVLDLARHPQYASLYDELQKVNLGDTVRIVDTTLDIDISQRVVKYDRDPFADIISRISVGNVIHDFTEHLKQIDEKKMDKEDEDTSVWFKGSGLFMVDNEPELDFESEDIFKSFSVGGLQVLDLLGANITDRYRDSLPFLLPIASVDEEEKTVAIRLLENAVEYYDVLVLAGAATYTNDDFINGLLTFTHTFPSDIKVFVSDGELDNESIVLVYGVKVEVGGSGEWSELIFLEGGTAELADEMTFDFEFEEGYDEVLSVTVGVRTSSVYSTSIPVVVSDIISGGKITGIKGLVDVSLLDGVPSTKISIQAMCLLYAEVVD